MSDKSRYIAMKVTVELNQSGPTEIVHRGYLNDEQAAEAIEQMVANVAVNLTHKLRAESVAAGI